MLKNNVILLLSLLSFFELWSQERKIDLEQLKAPTAPGATIINIQPNEINQPKSLKDLEAAIMTNYFGQGEGPTVPNNFMLELMPYWMGNRINTVPTDYLSDKIGDVFWQNLALSIASTQKYPVSDSIETNALGFGFRSLLRRGGFFEEYDRLIKILSLNQELQTFSSLLITMSVTTNPTDGSSTQKYFNDLVKAVEMESEGWFTKLENDLQNHLKEIMSEISQEFSDSDTVQNKQESIKVFRETLRDKLLQSHEDLKKLYNSYKSERKGLQLEVAGALALNFPTNTFEFSTIPKWGLWLTGTINPKKVKDKKDVLGRTSLITMIRYVQNDIDYFQKYAPSTAAYYRNNFDLGLKGLYQSEKFSVSVEVLSRYRKTLLQNTENPDGSISKTSNSDWDWKYLINLTYAVTPDISINYSFGKQLDPALSVNGNIISTASLNFGFGGPEVSDKE